MLYVETFIVTNVVLFVVTLIVTNVVVFVVTFVELTLHHSISY